MSPEKVGPQQQQRTSLIAPLEEARQRIKDQIDKGNELLNIPDNNLLAAEPDYHAWHGYATTLLRQMFSTEEVCDKFLHAQPLALGTAGDFLSLWKRKLRENIRQLSSINEQLELYQVKTDPPKVSTTTTLSNPVELVEHMTRRFHFVALQLRDRRKDREPLIIEDEYDLQYVFRALLRLFFDDIRPEESTPSCAGGPSRIDILLKGEQIGVEFKKTRPDFTTKQVRDDLLKDKGRYPAHPDCKTLICLVYDPDHFINNPDGFEKDLSDSSNEMVVKVIVAPKGQ